MNQIIPLSALPNQSLVVPLNIDGGVTDYTLVLRYNEVAEFWVLTLSNSSGTLILDSIPFVTGNTPAGNILGQYAYLKVGSAYILNVSSVSSPDYPNNLDLGTDFVLLWGDTPSS